MVRLLDEVAAAGLSAAEKESILWGNAARGIGVNV
jgi:predicted TIM-barrel fold metal-dependent hydrolase